MEKRLGAGIARKGEEREGVRLGRRGGLTPRCRRKDLSTKSSRNDGKREESLMSPWTKGDETRAPTSKGVRAVEAWVERRREMDGDDGTTTDPLWCASEGCESQSSFQRRLGVKRL